MKIKIHQIPPEGMLFDEQISPGSLDVETDTVKFRDPIKARAAVSRITNVVSVELDLRGAFIAGCSRCLGEFPVEFDKHIRLNYEVNKTETSIDLDPDIREEIILDYPLKPLCKADCLGLCPKCGKNLNEIKCDCAP